MAITSMLLLIGLSTHIMMSNGLIPYIDSGFVTAKVLDKKLEGVNKQLVVQNEAIVNIGDNLRGIRIAQLEAQIAEVRIKQCAWLRDQPGVAVSSYIVNSLQRYRFTYFDLVSREYPVPTCEELGLQ